MPSSVRSTQMRVRRVDLVEMANGDSLDSIVAEGGDGGVTLMLPRGVVRTGDVLMVHVERVVDVVGQQAAQAAVERALREHAAPSDCPEKR